MSATQTFNRPKGVRIVDMCIWVDAHMKDVIKPGENPQVEDKIVQYLYFIVDSLAKKQNFFPRFSDYDEFALYSASQLYITFRNKLQNAGQIVRGKEVIPVKSCLNFIKTVLYPYKVQFQQQSFDYVINPAVGQDTEKLAATMRDQVREQYRGNFADDLESIMIELPQLTHKMLNSSSPYRRDSVMMQNIYLSCILSFINNITLPNKVQDKIEQKFDKITNDKLATIYQANDSDIILWHLPDYMEDYIRIQIVKMKRLITEEIYDRRSRMDLSDEMVDSIMATAFTTYEQDREE